MDKKIGKFMLYLAERRQRILKAKLDGVSVINIAAKEGLTTARIYAILKHEGWTPAKYTHQRPIESPVLPAVEGQGAE